MGEPLVQIETVLEGFNVERIPEQAKATQLLYQAALDELKTETTNNPINGSAWIALGKELIELGAHQDALNAFAKAMNLAPQSAEPKVWMGYANYLLKNYAGAIALYKAALAIDKANSLIYKRMGLAYRENGDAIGAAQAFRRYLEIEPDAPDRAEYERYR
jgi:tetratricopeptide (TPR) repeat protein